MQSAWSALVDRDVQRFLKSPGSLGVAKPAAIRSSPKSSIGCCINPPRQNQQRRQSIARQRNSGPHTGHTDAVVGRRVFSREQKRAIVAEASGHGVNVSAVARRHGIKPSLLFRWRRDFAASAPQPPTGRFLAVSIDAPSVTKPTPPAKPATIEIELAFGRKLRVASDIDAAPIFTLHQPGDGAAGHDVAFPLHSRHGEQRGRGRPTGRSR